MTRFVAVAAGLVLIGVLGFVIDAQSRIPVDRPKGQTGPSSIFAPGRVEGATEEVALRFEVAGRVDEVLVEEGQRVQKGEVLLRLDARQYQTEVDQAAAAVHQAEAELERLTNGARPQERAEARAVFLAKQEELQGAELKLNRIAELQTAFATAKQTADDQRTLVARLRQEVAAAQARLELLEAPARPDEVLVANARILAAQAGLDSVELHLNWTTLRAPGSAQILKINVEAGELTGRDAPEPAVILADTSKYRVRAFVEEMDAPRVQVGMTAKITADGLPGRELKGRVVRLSPQMSRKSLWSDQPAERFDTKIREVWIELEEAESLVVGLRVDVTIDPGSVASGRGEPSQPENSEPYDQPSPVEQQPLAHPATGQP